MTAGITSAGKLNAQEPQPPVSGKTKSVVLCVAVTDQNAGYVNGLKSSDFRLWEDEIPQKLATFSEANNVYTITYDPDPSNTNEGFRKIKVEIVTDVDKRWRVRHRQGYRP